MPTHVVLTRNGSTQEVAGYVNGTRVFAFIDCLNQATFDGPNDLYRAVQLVRENTRGGSGSGIDGALLDYVRLYDGALTPAQVENLYAVERTSGHDMPAVPAPANLLLGAIGAVGLFLGHRRHRRPAAAA